MCEQAQQEMPLPALPTAARQCNPAGMVAHLIILMESPALVALCTKVKVAQGASPHSTMRWHVDVVTPSASPRCHKDVASASSPAHSSCCTAWLPVQWGSPGRTHCWDYRSAVIQIHQGWLGVLKKPPVIEFEWQISNLFSVLLGQSAKLASATQLPIHDT